MSPDPTALEVCLLMVTAPIVRLVRVFVGSAGVDGWEGSALFERMYLLGGGVRSGVDVLGLYGGTFGGQVYADRSWLGDPSLLITLASSGSCEISTSFPKRYEPGPFG